MNKNGNRIDKKLGGVRMQEALLYGSFVVMLAYFVYVAIAE
jgi:hypothetical protein